MNVFKSGEQMLRLSGRFTSVCVQQRGPLSHPRTALAHRRSCTVPSARPGRTLLEQQWTHRVRFLCQQVEERGQAPAVVSDGGGNASETFEGKVSFYKRLQGCASPSDVLDLVGHNAAFANISNSLWRLWETTKMMRIDQRRCELRLMLEHPGFRELCRRARIEAPHMLPIDLAHTLLAMVRLGILQRSLVEQTLLRVIQERLNDFDERSLSMLCTCLQEMESCSNTSALKEGLKLILEDRIPKIDSVVCLQKIMCMFGEDTSEAITKKLEMKALSMTDQFTLPNAQFMIITLATMNLNSRPLLDICSKKLAQNILYIPYDKLLRVLESCRVLSYKNFVLFSSVSQHLVNTFNMWPQKRMISLLLQLQRLRFRPEALLDMFADSVIQSPDSLTLRNLMDILQIYSFLNHDLKEKRAEFLAAVTHVLESYLPKMSPVDLLKAVSFLSHMEHFPHAPLEKLLQKECLDELLRDESSLSNGVQMKLFILGLCLRLDSPPLPPTLSPIPHLHGFLMPKQRPINPELLSALTSLFGMAAVRESVVEEQVYFIDFVVTLPDYVSPKEHSVPAQKSRRVAVLCVSLGSFCFGTTHPCSDLARKIRHLKLLGYEPRVIPVQKLNGMPYHMMMQILKNFLL
ncbi:FAST kinase domain-containing protein 2, mitochondrial [Salminus brasiliensis]|uniref:FAST kinase domain-containing protein 2, mitochondrial n=1 Tax=Salminus brasiliensis TaxID=930266 RepID=UPI003B831C27